MESTVDQGTVLETAPVNGSVDSNTEKMIPQSAMNEIIRQRINEDRQKRESNIAPNYPSPGNNQYRALSEEDVRRIQDEHLNKRLGDLQQQAQQEVLNQEATRISNSFTNKFESAKRKYDDFETEVGKNAADEFGKFTNVVRLISDHVSENSEDVIYELGKSGSKLASLEICASQDPQKALKDINKLIKSIKQNEEAKNLRVPNQPLSQNRPSTHTVGSIPTTQYDWEANRQRFKA